jgi:ribosomal RNA-processing protein 1
MAHSGSTSVSFFVGTTNGSLDKFYLLARRYVAAGFKFLQKQDWSEEYVGEYAEMLSSGPLSPKNLKIPNSIRYHITDIYIDELEKIQPFESADDDFASTVEKLIEPFEKLAEMGLDKTGRTKAMELLGDPRLNAGSDVEDVDETERDKEIDDDDESESEESDDE